MAGKPKTLAKAVHLYAGFDLIGSKSTINSREAQIFVYDWGVKTISKKTGRIIRLYASNIKGLEEMPPAHNEEADSE